MKYWRWVIILLIIIILAVLVKSINEVSFLAGRGFYRLVPGWDPDDAYLTITVHHMVQGIFALAAVFIYGRVRNLSIRDFGFKWSLPGPVLKYVIYFVLAWTVIQLVAGYLLVRYYGEPIVFAYPFSYSNFISHLAFQLLLSGTSEEILFRAMVITISADMLRPVFRGSVPHSLLIGISTLIFMFDHINFDFSDWSITHFNILQQITLLIFGIFYGWLFLRYRNYWGPVIAHNLLNGMIGLSTLLLYLIFK